MAKEVVLNFRLNGVDQAEQLGNNLEKAARGVADLIGGLALFGENSKTIEELQKNFAKIVGITQAVKGGVEAISASMKALGGPITAVIAAIGLIVAGFIALNQMMIESSDATKALEAENEKLTKQYERQKAVTASRVSLLQSELDILIASKAPAEEIAKKQKEINDEKEKELLLNIESIRSSIKLNQSKINDVAANNSLYESYLELTASVQRFLGESEAADRTELLIALNKKERAEEFKKVVDEQTIALENAENEYTAFKNKLTAEQITADNKAKESSVQRYKDTQKAAEEAAAAEQKMLDDIEKRRRAAEAAKAAQEDKEYTDSLNKKASDIETRKQLDLLAVEDSKNANLERLKIEQAYLDEEKNIALKQARDKGENTALIENEYAVKSIDLAKQIAEEEEQIEIQKRERQKQLAASAISILSGIGDLFVQKNKKDAEKAFKINKAFALSTAIANTGLAVVNALTAGGNAIKLATGAQFVDAGIAAAAGAIQIAKIAASKFEGGGGSTSGGAESISGGASSVQPQPTFNPQLFATGGQSEQTISANQQPAIRAYVVEQEITSTQRRVQQIQERASL